MEVKHPVPPSPTVLWRTLIRVLFTEPFATPRGFHPRWQHEELLLQQGLIEFQGTRLVATEAGRTDWLKRSGPRDVLRPTWVRRGRLVKSNGVVWRIVDYDAEEAVPCFVSLLPDGVCDVPIAKVRLDLFVCTYVPVKGEWLLAASYLSMGREG